MAKIAIMIVAVFLTGCGATVKKQESICPSCNIAAHLSVERN